MPCYLIIINNPSLKITMSLLKFKQLLGKWKYCSIIFNTNDVACSFFGKEDSTNNKEDSTNNEFRIWCTNSFGIELEITNIDLTLFLTILGIFFVVFSFS